MKKLYKNILLFSILLLFIVTWSYLLVIFTPEEIVSYIGVEEGYFFVFLVSIVGGVTTIVATSFYATIMTLVAGGLNFLLVGLLAGAGATIGDSIFYYLGIKLRESFLHDKSKYTDIIYNWIKSKPNWKIYLLIYIYAGFTPLPKDALIIALAISGYSYKKMIIPLILGNITLMILLGYLTIKGIEIF